MKKKSILLGSLFILSVFVVSAVTVYAGSLNQTRDKIEGGHGFYEHEISIDANSYEQVTINIDTGSFDRIDSVFITNLEKASDQSSYINQSWLESDTNRLQIIVVNPTGRTEVVKVKTFLMELFL